MKLSFENGDCYFNECIEVMGTIPDSSVDMILCDLPYQVTARQKWDIIIPFEQLWQSYKRIAKPNAAIVLFATEPFRTKLISSNYDMFKYDIIWEKNKTTGFLNAKKCPLRKHESILVFYDKQPVYNPQKTTNHKPVNAFTHHNGANTLIYGKTKSGIKGGGQTDRYPTSVIKFDVVNNDSKEKFHSAQKPLPLFEWLIKTYSNEGELVLDNCAGSFTTAIAAINTNRKFICIENDKNYFDLAMNRIENCSKK